jgi:hypothetical protein
MPQGIICKIFVRFEPRARGDANGESFAGELHSEAPALSPQRARLALGFDAFVLQRPPHCMFHRAQLR